MGVMLANLRDWAILVVLSRALNAPQGADAQTAGPSPEENGASAIANANAQSLPGSINEP